MTEAQIQAFFDSKVKTCLGGSDQWGPIICLKDYRTDSVNRPADAYCKGYTGAKGESAARIIHRVAQSCGINPQVLIVMLQKEQSLVTHTWPSAWRYDKALGQGCPDDAPCNPAYVGFFHQIYGAARQMQTYLEGKYFTWYAPGKTWNILYHPNRDCGTSPVLVANKATSALYYYTPYQPNAAALRAGYGTGDACSSYGNRNFYNYFTDWFGSTQATVPAPSGSAPLVLKVGVDIFYISQGTRYHITPEDWSEYRAKFGDPKIVASVSSYADGGDTSRLVRNSRTGEIAYFTEGKTHRFSSCELIVAWGANCYARVEMSDSDFRRIGSGPEISRFARLAAGGTIHQIEGRTLVPLYDDAAATAANDGVLPFAAVMAPAQQKSFTVRPRVQFAPGQFVSSSGSDKVYLATQDGRTLHVPTWDLIKDMGLPRTKITVPAAALDHYSGGELQPVVQCAGVFYAPSGTGMRRLSSGNTTGIAETSLDASACARLRLETTPTISQLFVRFAGTDAVLHVAGGVTRHVATTDQVRALNGGYYPPIMELSAGTATAFVTGAAYTSPGTLVRADGTEEVWLVDGRVQLLHLPDWETSVAFGLGRTVSVEDPTVLSAFPRGGDVLTRVVCSGIRYQASGGAFARDDASPTAPATELAPETCQALGVG
ncbi:hypothetical protein GCM10022383_03090 [Microbacterium soli]|uniref:Uncharacterized protein n=2 Tax=Microbacterium soli TaxID=446075 RepID=A0ABP7MRV8_9MICO